MLFLSQSGPGLRGLDTGRACRIIGLWRDIRTSPNVIRRGGIQKPKVAAHVG
jgi:hypothetical protein